MYKDKIMEIVKCNKDLDWGKWANILQDQYADYCEKNGKEAEWNQIYDRMEKDYNTGKDEDGAMVNGVWYDWKVFDAQRDQIIEGFLGYFNEDQLKIIYDSLVQKLLKLNNSKKLKKKKI